MPLERTAKHRDSNGNMQERNAGEERSNASDDVMKN